MSQMWKQFTDFFKGADVTTPTQSDYFALMLDMPPHVTAALEDIRQRYDPAHRIGYLPHITVKRPAALPNRENLPLMRAYLRNAALKLPPIHIQLSGYDIFRSPNRNVVYLKVADEAPFIRLHKAMVEALANVLPGGAADQFENDAYHPHLTIGNELSDLDLAVLQHELESGKQAFNFSFELDSVVLYVGKPGQKWPAIEVFHFGG
jgi:2'-5' RNA ligase